MIFIDIGIVFVQNPINMSFVSFGVMFLNGGFHYFWGVKNG